MSDPAASGAPLSSGQAPGLSPPNQTARPASATSEKHMSLPGSDTAGDYDSEMERRHSIVQDLARAYTNQSHADVTGTPFTAGEDSPLNPASKNFSARAWAKSVVRAVQDTGGQFRTSGVAFQDLNVFGYGEATDYQKSVGNIWLALPNMLRTVSGNKGRRIDILRDFNGTLSTGEMLIVLGPPGAGCTTFLKTIAGEHNGINIDENSKFNYQGIDSKEMHSAHRGEVIYTAEVDAHFPNLTVGETLSFAARARQAREIPNGISRDAFAQHMRDVTMAMFGISHTVNTCVGNEFIRGVSGGERKRVTIAEACLSQAPLQCWDNSTRGLDSANAVEFCKTLRLQAELFGSAAAVSIYQAPQDAYDLFDKATVLYEGRQIYFGPATEAKGYFESLGFECPDRQTVPDFLTSMTSPRERIVRKGWEGRAPRTPDEFATAWKNSDLYQRLRGELVEYNQAHPINGPDADAFRLSKRAQQAKNQRNKSPYTLSYIQQVNLTLWRAWRRLIGDPSVTIGQLIANSVMGLIIASVFYDVQPVTSSFFQRGALIFFACLMNAFSSALEIFTLYAQRPIVEKHSRYALYHPSAEAVASMLMDMPYKILNTLVFNTVLYFMTNLRREAGAFFFFIFMSFMTVMVMSMIFRTIASASRTLSQAMVPAAILILALVIFTGFVIPIDYMLGWCRWMNYIDPLAYAFESFMVNEFTGRQFLCDSFVPNDSSLSEYSNIASVNRICTTVGSITGESFVDGDRYLSTSFQYEHGHKWRNVGILVAFILFFFFTYIVCAEVVSERRSKGEVLVFRRGYKPAAFDEKAKDDLENLAIGPMATHDRASTKQGGPKPEIDGSIFHWENVCYDVQIKDETRRILDHVNGWVKPGTMTALMGVSGAGKTTLLDCLADRINVGVITGDMLVDGHPRDSSFQRKTGYVQQQDLHLETTTVREALNFSAILRQPAHVSREEKLAYVDQVIAMLDMEEYADAVVGVPGSGLNVEQRKRLSIGVELAAKPPVLLFVDEPTSGLDSQTSWAILDLLEKLTKAGQAILCTIHQPSAMLFQRFDRLLFLRRGGQTIYFGDIGKESKTLTSYFERNGANPCPREANPAEWMLEVIGAAPGSHTDIDWHETWKASQEAEAVRSELQNLRSKASGRTVSNDETEHAEFSAPFGVQFEQVLTRVMAQYWRTPSYIYSKFTLCLSISLFIGFVFYDAPNTIQGLQNQMFSIFQLFTVFGQLMQQTLPYFVIQRDLYEVRERPSKVYSWWVFMLSQIIVELPWNSLMAVVMFFCWYYPIGLYRNAEPMDQVTERGGLMFLYLLMFLLFTSTFCDMVIAGFQTAQAGANMGNLLFMMCLIFCGILASPDDFPGFWIFMYRVSPFTYLSSGMLSVGLANTNVVCADNEYLSFEPLEGQTCGEYMAAWINKEGGYLLNSNATTDCQYCSISDTNIYLSSVSASYGDRWRNIGLLAVYIVFNAVAALAIYWLVRVPKKQSPLAMLFGKKKAE
ncbi:ABC transporter CDR4 [Ceratocystis lukuohia]|uniref:ABC transporter CDR4 n=1 Tax=Ceratocystis lukuohia TaxID=2019550 RepID=A0ABR4MP80_9PEZI